MGVVIKQECNELSNTFPHSFLKRSLLVALVLPFAVVLAACSPPKSKTVRLPSGAEAPAVTDSSFVELLDSLIAEGVGDAGFVCVLQF